MMKRSWTVTILLLILFVGGIVVAPVSAQKRDDGELLRARETVWHAWFAGDTGTLKELVPPETIVMSGGEDKWKDQADLLRTSAEFHAKGGKLIRLEFPRTEVQHFGEVAARRAGKRLASMPNAITPSTTDV